MVVEAFIFGLVGSLALGLDLTAGRTVMTLGTTVGLWLLIHALGFFLVGLVALARGEVKK